MSEAKFTPGPWKLESDNYTGSNDESFLEWVEAGPARVYLSRHNPTERAEQVANANLIAAFSAGTLRGAESGAHTPVRLSELAQGLSRERLFRTTNARSTRKGGRSMTRDRVSDAVGLLYDTSHQLQPSISWPDAWCVFVLVLAALVVTFG